MTFAVLLLGGAREEAVHTVREFVVAARAAGHRADIFLAGDGVVHGAALAALGGVTLCAADARWRGLAPGPESARFGSLADWAELCRAADRTLVFG